MLDCVVWFAASTETAAKEYIVVVLRTVRVTL
jgi:hypothetical protein